MVSLKIIGFGNSLECNKRYDCCLWRSKVLRPASSWAQRRWLNLASLGAAIMLGCVWTDRALCAAFGSVFNFVHLLFLGCDIVFFAFWVLYSGAGEYKNKQL